jgi:hypothetical protein
MVSFREPCYRLARSIVAYWQSGITVSESDRRFIDATFGALSPAEIELLLADPDADDRELLIELLLFPDEAFLASIEPQAAVGCFTPADERSLLAILMAERPPVGFFLGPATRPLVIDVPAEAVARFVSRMRITRQFPLEISNAITACLPEVARASVGVKLRQGNFPFTEAGNNLLKSFFEFFSYEEPDFEPGLTFLVGFLDELGDAFSITRALMEKRTVLSRHLTQAAMFARRLQQSNMETLMLEGVRQPCINPQKTRQVISIIDGILRRIFDVGSLADRGVYDMDQNLGTFNAGCDMEELVDKLS